MITNDWQEIVFGKLGKTYTGLTGKTKDDFGSGKPFIPYLNVFSNSRINPADLFYVKIDSNENQNKVKYGDLFFTTSSETVEEVGMTSVLLEDIGEAYLNSFCFGFRLNNFEILLPEFAPYLFRNTTIRHQISLKGQGSTRYNLSKTELLRKLVLKIPSKPEQTKITEILKTLDTAIEQTQQLIAKYQLIKTGLMQDLLTKGIDKKGNIRSKETHKFVVKNGIEVPEEWEVDTLGNFCKQNKGSIQTGPFGSQLHSEDYKNEGTPIITVEHLFENTILHQNLPLVGETDCIRLKKYKLIIGDLVFSRVGAIDRCSITTTKENGWLFSGRCLRVRGGIGFNPYYLLYQMNFDIVKGQILNNAVGSTMKCLNTKIMTDIFVIKPPISEQKIVAEKLISIDNYIETENNNLNKLHSLKTSLMQDLLSGKVRVKVKEVVCQ